MQLKLRHKVNSAILITFVLIAALFTAIGVPLQKQRTQWAIDNAVLLLRTLTARDREPLANEIFERRVRAIQIRLDEMIDVKGVVGIEVFDERGVLITYRGIDSGEQRLDPESIRLAMKRPLVERRTIAGHSLLLYLRGIDAIGERIGFIRLLYSLQRIEQERQRALLLFGATLLTILLAMLLLLNLLLSRSILRPLTQLQGVIARISDGDLKRRAPSGSRDEIGQLAASFNAMTDQLEITLDELTDEVRTRQQAETLQRQLQTQLINILDSMPSVMIGIDRDGRVTHWNQQARRVTGLRTEQAVGLPVESVYPALRREHHLIEQAFVQLRAQSDHKVMGQRNGQTCYEDITVYPLSGNGEAGAVIRIDDVTERTRLEEIVIQSEKMMSVGGLAAGMAHEINNPLAGILQNIQVIRNRFDLKQPLNREAAARCGIDAGGLDCYLESRKVLKMMETVRESGERAAAIVRNMLDFSRKSGSGFLPVDLAELIDKTIELATNDYDLKKQHDFRRIEIRRDYADGLPPLPCDNGQIQQVILNLLKNGAQAMAAGRRALQGEGMRFDIRLRQRERNLRLEIEDNGPGMPDEVRKRVFEPFFTTKEVGIGTGLGLSVAYFIITEAHRGQMWVESTPGRGSCFIIELPLDGSGDERFTGDGP